MKVKHYENIVKYLPVLIACLLIGILGRIYFISKGADEFTVNVVFVIFTGFGISIYAIFGLFFNELIELGFKIFQKKKTSEISEKQISPNENLEKIRAEQEILKNIEKQNKIKIAIEYTQKQFALYMSDEDLEELYGNIIIYAQAENFQDLKPVETNNLATQDLEHFGWNIYNHFNNRIQDEAAEFIKLVFSTDMKGVEIPSIKSHLKTAPEKGKIKLEHNLSRFCENN